MKVIKSSIRNIATLNNKLAKSNLQVLAVEKKKVFEKVEISTSGTTKVKGGVLALDIDGL